jgi:hypothetical protein
MAGWPERQIARPAISETMNSFPSCQLVINPGACQLTLISRPPLRHHLKTDPVHFAELKADRKSAELRFNDRDYRVGDTLELAEFDRDVQTYSGDTVERTITHILTDGDGPWLAPGYCMLSLSRLPGAEQRSDLTEEESLAVYVDETPGCVGFSYTFIRDNPDKACTWLAAALPLIESAPEAIRHVLADPVSGAVTEMLPGILPGVADCHSIFAWAEKLPGYDNEAPDDEDWRALLEYMENPDERKASEEARALLAGDHPWVILCEQLASLSLAPARDAAAA